MQLIGADHERNTPRILYPDGIIHGDTSGYVGIDGLNNKAVRYMVDEKRFLTQFYSKRHGSYNP